MRRAAKYATIALMCFGSVATRAQDMENGKRIAERWCADCHATGSPTSKARHPHAMPFQTIANKPGVSSELIAEFLMLPHVTMPNLLIKKSDAEDVAALIMELKR